MPKHLAGIFSACGLFAIAASTSAQGIPPAIQPAPRPAPALPATAPTVSTPAPAFTSGPLVIETARPARVDSSAGLITVTADNSSLNQILREISRLTGLKITGGVADERVYGIYGPTPLQSILATLLEGTGSNMLLIQDARNVPREIVLTPRQGGPSPPNPLASRESDEQIDLPPQLTPRVRNVPVLPIQPGDPLQPSSQSPQATPMPVDPGDPTATTAPTGSTTQQSPNGVKTPQQIYDQLMKLQQQPKTSAPQ